MDATGDVAARTPPEGGRLTDAERDALVVDVVRQHADGLLRLARRHSLCADDAQDAYQRGLEIMLRHAHRLDPERAPSWLRTVVKHEAMAVRRTRQRDVAPGDLDFDRLEARTTPSPDERAVAFEHVARSAEALQRLKPQEVRALWLRAQGNSYEEIRELTGWSRTKVNRCLYEGRRSFLERYAGIASGAECERWQPLLSRLVDGEASREELVELRPHLRACPSCRAVVRELHRASAPLAIVLPVGAVVAHADAALEPAGHLFLKVYDTATTWLGERAASSFVRAQIAVDAVSTSAGKLTAVAAASAAVAGGGAVALDHAEPASRQVVAVAPLSRAAEPADAGGSQRRLTIEEQVARRVAAARRRLERRAAAAARSRSAARRSATAAAAPAVSRSSAATAPQAAPQPAAGAAASAPAPVSAGPSAELGLE